MRRSGILPAVHQTNKAVSDFFRLVVSLPTCLLAIAALLFFQPSLEGADLDEAKKLFAAGQYEECLISAVEGVEQFKYDEKWWRLKLKAELQLGLYADAKQTLETALQTHRASIMLRELGYEAYAFNNEPEKAEEMHQQIDALVRSWPSRYSDAESSLVIGRMLLSAGADARKVLELFYDRAKGLTPRNVDVYIATADLALEKFADDLAAKDLQKAIELEPVNADLHYRLSRAFANSDSQLATAALRKALSINPRHVDSLLWSAEKAIDGEQYDLAEEQLGKVLQVNPRHQLAWALFSVIAYLRGDESLRQCCYEQATEFWQTNPEVDHLIGRKISQKYGFRLGAEFQRRALSKRADYLPAKFQLAQDLLRLGEEEGWQLTEEVNKLDGYNVVMHNLMTLHDHLKNFRTLERDQIVVHMDENEAALYGEEALALLTEAKRVLGEKYNVAIDKPVIVEIFPQKSDFAIRTFGLPGGDGFLGVCFGRVITANSPASRKDSPSNWQSVLWHEFCHAVTLEKSNNRMPRWLSEGISVYEERQRNPAWGEKMNPRYREMMLGDELTPVSQLSEAFLSPPSGAHLMFAYYESSLVVEYLIEHYGTEMLQRVLEDLGAGMPINASLQRYTGSLAALDQEFAEYAREKANVYGKTLDWEKPELTANSTLPEIEDWNKKHEGNYWGLRLLSLKLVNEKKFREAQPVLKKLIELLPAQSGPANAYQLLATTHREFEESDAEVAVLNAWIAQDGDAVAAYRRLMEVYESQANWAELERVANLLLAVDPLDRSAHLGLSVAAEKLGDSAGTLRSLQRLLRYESTDLAETHQRVAKILYDQKLFDQAKRHTLMALEEAPRFREAHRLLLSINRSLDSADKDRSEASNEESQKDD